MIKAVILDLDGTLYAYEPLDEEARGRVRKYICEMLGISEQKYEEAYQFGRSETKRMMGDVAASHNRMLYFQKTLEYLDIRPAPMSLLMYDIYWGTFLDKMCLYDGAREFLDSMYEHGVKIMICTDLTAHIQHRKIEALGITEDVLYLVTSEEAGKEKPAPEVFTLCLNKLRVPAEEVCFIGDDQVKDVDGARAMGMQAILFEPDKPSAEQFANIEKIILEDRFDTL